MAEPMPRLMLLDTASLYFRAYFGIPDSIVAPDGTPVNAVRGLLDFISRLVSTYRPTELACCWDDDWRPGWRVALIPSYKAHRVVRAVETGVDVEESPAGLDRQVPVIRAVLEALGLAVVGAPGFEADDVIATLAARAGIPVDIVTGDRDLFQLVDDESKVRVLYTARGVGRHEIVDEADVVSRYGVLPQQYADFAVLRGDASDGLPGVGGIGAKTAASLLQRYGDLDSIRAAGSDPHGDLGGALSVKLRAASDYLAVASQVVRTARDVPLEDLDLAIPHPAPRDPGRFAELAETWGIGSAAVRVVDALNSTAQGASSTEE
jgi:5'-3' exonuclease